MDCILILFITKSKRIFYYLEKEISRDKIVINSFFFNQVINSWIAKKIKKVSDFAGQMGEKRSGDGDHFSFLPFY